jgi:hypothetical protein
LSRTKKAPRRTKATTDAETATTVRYHVQRGMQIDTNGAVLALTIRSDRPKAVELEQTLGLLTIPTDRRRVVDEVNAYWAAADRRHDKLAAKAEAGERLALPMELPPVVPKDLRNELARKGTRK